MDHDSTTPDHDSVVPEGFTPRVAAAIGLLALVPAVVYAIGRPSTAGYVAAVNVVLAIGLLYIAFGPAEGGSDHGANGST